MKSFYWDHEFRDSDLDTFISISGDNALFHSSDQIAREHGFKRRICHGVMCLMPFSRYLGMEYPGNFYVILEASSKFRHPVYTNSKLHYSLKEIFVNDSLGVSKLNGSISHESLILVDATFTCQRLRNENS